MKKILMVLVALFISVSMNAQKHTIDGQNIPRSGYGGPVLKTGIFNGKSGLLSGGRGAMLINHKFAIGGGSYSTCYDLELGKINDRENPHYFNLSYGGLEMEYIHNHDKPFHWTVYSLVGGGTVKILEHNPELIIEKENLFVVEFGLNTEINVNSWFRINLGASYRLSSGLSLKESTNLDFNGPSGSIIFKFGRF